MQHLPTRNASVLAGQIHVWINKTDMSDLAAADRQVALRSRRPQYLSRRHRTR
jgi:hypothetical protein